MYRSGLMSIGQAFSTFIFIRVSYKYLIKKCINHDSCTVNLISLAIVMWTVLFLYSQVSNQKKLIYLYHYVSISYSGEGPSSGNRSKIICRR